MILQNCFVRFLACSDKLRCLRFLKCTNISVCLMQEDCSPIILDNEIPKGFKHAHVVILLLCLICIFNKLCGVLNVSNSQATFCISRPLESIFIMLRGSGDFSGGRTLVGPCRSIGLRLLPSGFVDSELWGN